MAERRSPQFEKLSGRAMRDWVPVPAKEPNPGIGTAGSEQGGFSHRFGNSSL